MTFVSPIYQAVNDGGDVRYCDNHVCRSPWIQIAWNKAFACNGCLARVIVSPSLLRAVDDQTQVGPEDCAWDLEDEQRGYQ